MKLNRSELQVLKVFGITSAITIAIGLSVMTYIKRSSERSSAGQARLTSLGTPKNIKDKTKGEKPVLMNDPAVEHNWGLMGTGGASDINASRAWKITQGSRNVIVAVIDTGIDIRHEDISNNLWVNNGEVGFDSNGKDKAKNGIDDDKNGFVDDVHGWNFVEGTNDLTDNHGHGTHVSGIIGAEGGNGVGISGVSPKVSLMVLKYYDPKARSTDNLKNTIRAIDYAVKMNAKIINYSGGGLDYSAPEFASVKRAQEKGILFVAAAGNERSNSDKSHYYPANYPLDNIISVTAINPKAQVLKSSNWGVNTVHIAAPGEQIFSTLPNNRYGMMTGTSQATSFVTGVAALIFSNNQEFDYKQVRNQILSTADQIPGMLEKTKTSGKLNSWAALAMQPPIPVSGIVANAGPDTNYTLGADGIDGSAPINNDNLRDLATFRNLLNGAVQ